MSHALTPSERWPEKIIDARIPANNNSLRLEIFNTDGVADNVTAQPALATPADDGKWYIIPAAATGTQWATFAEDSIAIFYGGTWYEFVPAEGAKVSVAGVPMIFDTGAWAPFVAPSAAAWGSITGTLSSQTDLASALAAKAGNAYTIVTEASAFTAGPGTHDGMTRYVRAGGDVTFDNVEPYTSGMAFNIRATGSIELIEDGVTLTPPAGGTLELTAGMAVQVVMTGATAGDVIGQTVAAP